MNQHAAITVDDDRFDVLQLLDQFHASLGSQHEDAGIKTIGPNSFLGDHAHTLTAPSGCACGDPGCDDIEYRLFQRTRS